MTEWLDDREMTAWVATLRASVLLLERLEAELQEAHGLSLADYEILAQLAAQPGTALRMSDLAGRALVSKSRLTHAVDRLVARGLVARQACETDRRGTFAVLTEAGRQRLEEAAPTHLAGVRRYLIDQCSPADLDRLARTLSRVVKSIDLGAETGRNRPVSAPRTRR